MAAAVRGDARAMQALWQSHRRWVAAVLLAYRPRHADLEDLLQEVAMTLVQKINSLREPGNFRAWLRAVAINAARAAARSGRYRKTTSLDDGEPLPGDDGVDPGLVRREHARRLMEAVDELPEIYREPLLLRAVHGMKSRQISEILDIPPATVDTRIARARSMLRAMLPGADHDGTPAERRSRPQPTEVFGKNHHERFS